MMKTTIAAGLLVLCLLMTGCAAGIAGQDDPPLPQPENTPAAAAQPSASPGKAAAQLVPDRLKKDAEGVPVLAVYNT